MIGLLRRVAVTVSVLIASVAAMPGLGTAAQGECRVTCEGTRVDLQTPFLIYRLDTSSGLRAQTWENRLTGRKLALGGGPELELDLAGAGGAAQTLKMRVTRGPVERGPGVNHATFELAGDRPGILARTTYRWDAKQPVLTKMVEVVNSGSGAVRLLNVRLGSYRTEAKIAAGEQGFPAYLDSQFFVTLAHPAGWAAAEGSSVTLRQYPGIMLPPGQRFLSMEAVFGVARAGEARRTFLDHLHGRMRRVVRGHDRPYAIFEPFGARPDGNFDETEAFVLDNLVKVARGQRESGCRFDYYSVDFWVDFRGDLKRFDPERFPNGLARINAELAKLGTAPGLWIDSSMTHWSIGGNPAVRPTFTHDPAGPAPAVPVMCRATEPIRSMYVEAFRHHVRVNGVRLLKFDNLISTCNNPNHGHLPGIYSTEAIQNAVIEFLHEMDKACPEVFLMLYWGHRSPWWLVHADTLFDSGIGIEAASPGDQPSPYARDSITQKLDQAQWHASDVPPLGKDSLGVWLSEWGWNSSVGKERWAEGFVMDICRGSLLAQPWSDSAWLSPPERQQMAELVALLRARPQCFAGPRFILGDPWKNEPYGYCSTDGKRAMVALNNCAWRDAILPLGLDPSWGLPGGRSWDLYRWHPRPARLRPAGGDGFGPRASIALRPFEVVLLEVVPRGAKPALDRPLPLEPIPTGFAESSRPVDLAIEAPQPKLDPADQSIWTVLRPASFRSPGGATLTLQNDNSILAGGKCPSPDTYTIAATTERTGITAIRIETLPDASLPGRGPGRAVNGNFMLNEFRVQAAPLKKPGAGTAVPLRNPIADFSQDSHGGWPIAAAIDGDPNTGWSIDPQEGLPHVAIFETRKPIGHTGGTLLSFTLDQGIRAHALGRFRLSVTTARPPLPVPKGYGPRTIVLKGLAPSTVSGGQLVLTAEMARGGVPAPIPNVGSHFTATGRLSGRAAPWMPVLGRQTYPASWQAWRLAVEPATAARPFELSIGTTLAPSLDWRYRGYFVPKGS